MFLLISPRNCATLFLLYLPSLEQLKYRYADCKSVSLQTFRDSITKSADSTASGIMTQNGYYGRPLSVAWAKSMLCFANVFFYGRLMLRPRLCVWLPFAAACCYTLFYLLMMPAVRLVCQRPSSKFPYFRTPLAKFLLSARTPWNTVILKQLHCCPRLNVRVRSSKVELAAAGVHPVGMISSHASV